MIHPSTSLSLTIGVIFCNKQTVFRILKNIFWSCLCTISNFCGIGFLRYLLYIGIRFAMLERKRIIRIFLGCYPSKIIKPIIRNICINVVYDYFLCITVYAV
jgi:formate/nitrite transporter FocA (FNT family)